MATNKANIEKTEQASAETPKAEAAGTVKAVAPATMHVVKIGFIDKNSKQEYDAGDIIYELSDERVKEINKTIPGAVELVELKPAEDQPE